MQAESFERLKARQVRDLTAEPCMTLITLLQDQAHEDLGEVVLQRRTEVVVGWPRRVYRGNTDLVRHGKDESRCQNAAEMADHKSVTVVAASGIGTAWLTAWRWSQKLLKVQANRPFPSLKGVAEADKAFFCTSYIGSSIGSAASRRATAHKRGFSAEQLPVLPAVDKSGGVQMEPRNPQTGFSTSDLLTDVSIHS